ncbi:MAG: FG-GAP-like repeat-containing protein, partial [Candidatus Acidiferrum sp.]
MPASRPPFFSHSTNRYFSSLLIAILLSALSNAVFPPALFASNNPVPYIDLVAPVSIHPGTTSVTLTVLGTGFISTSVVKWNSTSLTTTFVSSKKLTAAVPDSMVAAVGLGSITVVSPTPGGGASNVYYVPVASQESSTTFPSTPSSSITVGNTPQGITTADLNGDGNLDLAVANNGDNTVTILLGAGNGTFTTKSTPSAGDGANWVAIGDFNEDGIPDLAVANVNSTGAAGVTILLGHGDGTYTAGATLTTGSGPFAITTADFNGDGHLDLAVSNQNSNTISVFLGVGNGTFGSGTSYAVGSGPQVIIPGDFNEDGILDLAVSNVGSNNVSVLLGTGTGTFGTATSFSTGGSAFPIGLIAADFNGDNHLDLAAVNESDVAILLGNGAGSFILHSNPGTGSTFLIAGVAGDYNGDGKLDLVVSDEVAGEAFFLPGNGNGTFGSAETFTTAAGAFGVATADFNGDGALDLAVANGTANNVSIFLQRLPVSLSPTSLAFGNQTVGVASTAQTVTLTNNSGSSLTISSIAFTGADNGDFSSGGTCSTSSPVANNGTCTITITFTPGAFGARTATLTITDTAGNSPQTLGVTGTGTVSPPSITKTFGASSITLNSSTSLTFSISNPNSTSPLSGVAFTDSLPPGIVVSTPNGLTGTCGSGGILATAGSSSVTLSAGTLGASASCNFSVNVTGTGQGSKLNSVEVTSTEGGNGNTSSASISVISPPTIAISFTPTSIPLSGGDSSLNIIISNPNSPSLSGIAFSDTLPAGLTVSSNPNEGTNCGGTVIAVANSSTISMTGGSIGGGGNCSVDVHVTGIAAGTQSDTTGTVTSTEGGTGATSNTASLTVVAPPSIVKSFGASSIAPNGVTSLTLTITNPSANTTGLTGVAFTDSLPTGLVVATPNGLTNSCGGTATATAGSGSVSLSGGSVSTASNCTVSLNVTSSTSGVYNNTTAAVSSTYGGTGNTASASLSVVAPPSIAKAFGASTVPLNGSTSLSFTISNPNSSTLTGLAFTDSLPAGLVVATPSGLANTCSGTATAVAGSAAASLSAGTLTSLASCTVSLNVTGSSAGIKNNSVSITSTQGGTGNTSNASITVVVPPTITNTFGAPSIPLNGSTTLSFTVSNANAATALTGVAFSDSFPAGLTVSTPNGLTGSCGAGTITATAGASSINLSGASIAANSSCNFSINVTGATAGSQDNTTGAITSANGGTGSTSNTANLAVVAPPSIAKSFGASSIAPNGTTSLALTLANPSSNSVSLTGVGFTDSLPAGLVVATPNALANTCGGTATATAGSSSVLLSGATIPASGNCAVSLNVTSSTSGVYVNTTAPVTSTNGGTGNTANATLSVATPPSISSSFGAASIPLNSSTTLSFTVSNPNSSLTLSGLAFTDSLPSGLVVATPSSLSATCTGTVTAVAGSNSVTLAGGTLAPSSSCTVSLNVTSSSAGVKNNSVSITSTQGGAGNTSNASVTVVAPPTLAKAFGAPSVPLNGSTTLSFTVSNANTTTSLTGVSFNDTFPSGLVIATPNGLTGSCGSGTISAAAGSAAVALSAGTLAASSSCNFSVNVTGATAGLKSNLTGSIASTEGGTGGTASANLAVLAPPAIAKSFGASSIAPNATTSLTFTLTNPTANTQSLTGVTFTDPLPAGLVVAAPNALANTCGGTATAVAASGTVSLSGATIAASSICTLSVNVTATASGPLTNITNAVTSTNGGSGNTASASLTVGSPAAFTSSNAAVFVVGVSASFTITTTGSPTPSISLSGSLPAGLSFTDNGNGTATISGTPLAASTVGAFSITLTAHNGSGPDASQSFTLTLNKGLPTLTWSAPAAITYGTVLSSTQLDATSSVPGTFAYTPAAGTTLSAGSQSLSVLFTPTDSVDFTTASASVSITVNKATPVITWSAPSSAITYGTALSSAQLDATSSVAGTFVYTPAAGAMLNAGPQTLSVTFTPTNSSDNTTATDQISFTVNPASTSTALTASATSANPGASVTFTAVVASTAGTPPGSIAFLDGSTTLTTVPLASGSASFATSALAAGTHTITASYTGSTNFASSASATFTEIITTPDFSLASPPPVPMPSGQNINVPITVTPVGG